MPKKNLPPQVYKTETQLKEEARIKQAAVASASATVHKTDFEKKAENFWYHHKWHTIIGIFVAFLLVFFIQDMVFRTRPDTIVVVISANFIDNNALSQMTTALQEHATDYNGDKKVVISYDSIMLQPDDVDLAAPGEMPAPDLSGGQRGMADMMKLMTVLAAGTEMIYLLDETSYDYIIERAQGEVTGDDYTVFEDFNVPAEKLDSETSTQFGGMNFYLRTAYSDETQYDYCKEMLTRLESGK